MEKAIYKIENKINHKIYIGQSIHPEQRFKEHCKSTSYKSMIHDAIVKYGIENFDFQVLGWFEDYNEKEIYFIQYYRSLAPYGYNIAKGGENPPVMNGEDNPASKITKELAQKIQQQLLDWRIPRKTIVKNNKITHDIIRHINDGDSWYNDNLTYPLRPQEKIIDHCRVLYVQWLCCSSDIPLNQIGARVGWGRSSAKMINNGQNHYNEKLLYPLRDHKEENIKILKQETCIDYLHFEE